MKRLIGFISFIIGVMTASLGLTCGFGALAATMVSWNVSGLHLDTSSVTLNGVPIPEGMFHDMVFGASLMVCSLGAVFMVVGRACWKMPRLPRDGKTRT